MGVKLNPWPKVRKAALAKQAPIAGAAYAALYRAKPPEEQARIIARAMAGLIRYHARRRGEPEPIISTFDATMEPGKGVTQTSPLREFDL